jgi:hypothetical protein
MWSMMVRLDIGTRYYWQVRVWGPKLPGFSWSAVPFGRWVSDEKRLESVRRSKRSRLPRALLFLPARCCAKSLS